MNRVIWARGTPVNMVRVRMALEGIYAQRRRERERVAAAERRERNRRELPTFMWQDNSLVVVDSDGLRVVSNNRRVLQNYTTGILGIFRDDVVIQEGGRRNEEGGGGDDGREGVVGEGEGGRVVYPTPLEVVNTSGTLCQIFDSGEGLRVGGVVVDGLLREREEESRRRRGSSTSSGDFGELEDDSGAEHDLPSSGEN